MERDEEEKLCEAKKLLERETVIRQSLSSHSRKKTEKNKLSRGDEV